MNKPVSPATLYLDVGQVAERYGVSTDTIWRWKRHGVFPKPVKIGPGTTRWRMSDLLDHDTTFTCGLATMIEGDLDAFIARLAA